MLEHAPPFTAFMNRRAPEVWEQASSKLLDDRWLEVLTWKLKDKDSYLESRKRLGGARPVQNPPGGKPGAEEPGPIKKPPKKGAKGGGKETGGKGRPEAEAQPQA